MLPLIFLGACKKDITELNNDPVHPITVPASALFTQAQRQLTYTLFSADTYLNTYRLFEQQWQETTYITESNYQVKSNAIPDRQWIALYRDVLETFEQSKSQLPTYVTDAGTKKNDQAIIDIMQVHTFFYLLTTFGNIPYTEALGTSITPKFDDAGTVYKDLLKRLDADITSLDLASGSFGTADLIYSGDVAQWKKFANTLKLKMGITIADYDNALAKTTVESAVSAGVFRSNSDNANFKFGAAYPSTNPIWEDLVQSGRKDFVGGATIVNTMKATGDPRLSKFFTTDANGEYSGGIIGSKNSYGAFSKPSTTITQPSYPGLILDYSETEFNLAEAAERGYSVGETAATHYNNAITASVLYWGGTEAEATAYLAKPTVAYATATGNFKQKIGNQKWLAMYNRGWDAWIENRRLDYPQLQPPPNAISEFPVRMPYPVVEQNVNGTNYAAAASAIGGDVVTTKLFFDKF